MPDIFDLLEHRERAALGAGDGPAGRRLPRGDAHGVDLMSNEHKTEQAEHEAALDPDGKDLLTNGGEYV